MYSQPNKNKREAKHKPRHLSPSAECSTTAPQSQGYPWRLSVQVRRHREYLVPMSFLFFLGLLVLARIQIQTTGSNTDPDRHKTDM